MTAAPTIKTEEQSDPLQESLQREAEELFEAGDYDDAGEKFYFLAESYNHAGDTAREIASLQNMGVCLSKMQQLDKVSSQAGCQGGHGGAWHEWGMLHGQ